MVHYAAVLLLRATGWTRCALQQADTYALVCPRCRRINRVRVNLAATVRFLIFFAVMGEIQIWNALTEVFYRHVFEKLPAGLLRQEAPLIVLVSIIGLSIRGLIKAARVIEGKATTSSVVE